MASKLSRRDVLRWSGAGALALTHPLAGCWESEAPWTDPAPDPTQPWWMQGNFAPVLQERDVFNLEVEGSIPRSLNGRYLRNGPNPKSGDRGHWFLGDGMLHGVRLQDGKALWYRNRFVRTLALGRTPEQRVDPISNPAEVFSNVNVVRHAGRVLSPSEGGLPYEVTDELATVGPYDFGGRLKTWMTAHPKIDPISGELHAFGYGVTAPFLTYHLVNAAGTLVRSEPIDLPWPVMMHDFQITATKVVFMDLPITLDFAAALLGSRFPFVWDPSNGARLGVMPRTGGNADVIWFEIEPCFVFHAVNAFDDAQGNVVLEVCRSPQYFARSNTDFDSTPRLHRFTLDLARRSVKSEPLDDLLMEFPQIDQRLTGREYRYGYGVWSTANDLKSGALRFRGIAKYDRVRDTTVVNEFARHLEPGEPVFVPAAPGAAEDEGWLLTFVHDRREDRSSLDIFDARRVEGPPVARIKLPVRVPVGAHGAWLAA
jgi:carotenoid cleavage dioxygenase-like enzyme